MNAFKKTLLALGIGLAATAITRAQEVPVERTRAEVIAELDAARSGGELGVLLGEDSGSFHLASQPMAWTRTRAEVRAEAVATRKNGESTMYLGEDSGSFYLMRMAQRQEAVPAYAGSPLIAEAKAR